MNIIIDHRTREERREDVEHRNVFGRTWVIGITHMRADVSLQDAARMYRQNWDGCQDLWKIAYRSKRHKPINQN